MHSFFEVYDLVRKSEFFDADYYASIYGDVADQGVEPIIHYLEVGAQERRRPSVRFDPEFYVEQCAVLSILPDNPLVHYLTDGVRLGLRASRDDPVAGIPQSHPPAAPLPGGRRAKVMPLCVEVARVGLDGVLDVVGWSICTSPLEAVEILVEGRVIGAAETDLLRDDVSASHPQYASARTSGFVFRADVGEFGAGRKAVVVRSIGSGGISRSQTVEVDFPALDEDRSDIPDDGRRICCESINIWADGLLAIKGWAICQSSPAEVTVFWDEAEVGKAKVNINRPDIGNRYPALAVARRAGFSFGQRLATALIGEHIVSLKSACQGREHLIRLPVSVPPASEATGPSPSSGAAADTGRRLNIDHPRIIDGIAVTPVRDHLEVTGWAVARAGVASIAIEIDNGNKVVAHHGIRRPDVQKAFAEWEESLGAGFSALIPRHAIPTGLRLVKVTLTDKNGETSGLEFRVEVEAAEEKDPWGIRTTIPAAEVAFCKRLLARADWKPTFFLLMAVDTTAAGLAAARQTLESVRRQAYPDWILSLVPQARAKPQLLDALASDPRIRVQPNAMARPLHDFASADSSDQGYILLVQPGDELAHDALLQLALATCNNPTADFLYTNEERFDGEENRIVPYLKGKWSPDLLLSTNYIGNAFCIRATLARALHASLVTVAKAGIYDLVLRCTERAARVEHVPVTALRTPSQADAAAELNALRAALARRGVAGKVELGTAPGVYRVRRTVQTKGLVSIVIPTRASRGLIRTCIQSLRRLTRYRNFEIVCIENIPEEKREERAWLAEATDRMITTTESFNWSRFNNTAAEASRGEFLLFLNDDVEIIDSDWLDAMLEHGQRPEIGVVGARLLYPDRTIQHVGLFLSDLNQARHAFRYAHEDDPGYFGMALALRNVIAVTGACLLTRCEVFDRLGRFDEQHNIINNDLDYCLRAWEAGLLNIVTPYATLIHHEVASRAEFPEEFDDAGFSRRWSGVFAEGDPYFPVGLKPGRDDLARDFEPTRALVCGGPTIPRADIRKILIVKLDHIGDAITAIPAVRRLAQLFPDATLTVLCGGATKSVWANESSVKETLTFDFFHARSALGPKELQPSDWTALAAMVKPYGFDLAIDLRKHPETREVLQHTGAPYLVGFDWGGRFPWLDVALEWAGDQAYTRKRQHASLDLINLIDALGAAVIDERVVAASMNEIPHIPPPRSAGGGPLAGRAPAKAIKGPRLAVSRTVDDALFRRPVICIHPGAGNEMKQWPADYFAALICRLIAGDSLNVALIGGGDDRDIVDQIVKKVAAPKRVVSLVGRLKLAELPNFLRACRLFIGNDSGPKHIASAVGIPTIAIHGGTVDAREWGPVGPFSIAVLHDVACSPCFLNRLSDCPRDLACLRELSPHDVYRVAGQLLAGELPSGAVVGTTPRRAATATRRRRNEAKPK
jgi:ADP-heptose:LPS heptosyltransferase/GT2 family glycosyltransferase